MSTSWTRWVGLLGVAMGVAYGACAAPETFPGDIDTGTGGGTGGTGGTTSGTTSTTTGPICTDAAMCEEDDENPCTVPACTDGACTEVEDDSVIPPGGDECNILRCEGGEKKAELPGEDTGCGADPTVTHCNGSGKCIGCTIKDDCATDTECQTWDCVNETCEPTNALAGDLPDPKENCTKRRCDGAGGLVVEVDLEDVPAEENPPNECTKEECLVQGMPAQGVPAHTVQTDQACGTPQTCTDTFEKAQDTCNAAGVCQSGAEKECLPFVCDTMESKCKTTCTPDTQDQDCAAGYCEANVCEPKIEIGNFCGAGGQCFTGFCVDGVCCNGACDTACNSCDLGGGTPGLCSPLPKGVIDTCAAGSACNSGVCSPLSTKKAVGQSCIQESDCYNDVGSSLECIGGFCRMPLGSACDQGPSWHCSTRFCTSTGVCAECTDDANCGPGGACDMGGIDRCDFGAGGTCGNNNECVAGTTCMGSSASGPGTCQ